jgi:site-specific recombinase XerD
VRTPDLRAFLADEATRRPAPSSQSRTIAALKNFFRFCVENGYLDRDPALAPRTPKKREALPDVLDLSELRRLLAVTDREDVWQRHFPGKRERDRLMPTLLAYGGLRRSELLGLDGDDIDLGRRLVRVRQAKGGPAARRPDPPSTAPRGDVRADRRAPCRRSALPGWRVAGLVAARGPLARRAVPVVSVP